jgi:hypothetical protein
MSLNRGSGMSKNNNVNPGQYKVAGRERQGEDIVHNRQREQLTKSTKKTRAARTRQKRER